MSRAAIPTSAKRAKPPQPRRDKAPSAATSEAATSEGPAVADPALEQRVREAAYFIYERSGRVDGRQLENWLEAEALLLGEEVHKA